MLDEVIFVTGINGYWFLPEIEAPRDWTDGEASGNPLPCGMKFLMLEADLYSIVLL